MGHLDSLIGFHSLRGKGVDRRSLPLFIRWGLFFGPSSLPPLSASEQNEQSACLSISNTPAYEYGCGMNVSSMSSRVDSSWFQRDSSIALSSVWGLEVVGPSHEVGEAETAADAAPARVEIVRVRVLDVVDT